MKFAHIYEQHLLEDGFPEHWKQCAISYRKLKKCIKRLQRELSDIGLDADTLSLLLKKASENNGSNSSDSQDEDEKPFQYVLSPQRGSDQTGNQSSSERFRPKLLFTIDEATGDPIHATLSPETKQYLHRLAVTEKLTDVRITDENDDALSKVPSNGTAFDEDGNRRSSRRPSREYRMVEVPLESDSQFFGMLQSELSGLAAVQAEEEKKLSGEVEGLSNTVAKMTQPKDSKSKHDLQQWRRIFELYLDSRIFFSTSEKDPWAHNYQKAAKGYDSFATELQKQGLMNGFKRKEGAEALSKFVNINAELLQSLRFQEINNTATMKILKSRCFYSLLHHQRVANVPFRVRQTYRSRRQTQRCSHLPTNANPHISCPRRLRRNLQQPPRHSSAARRLPLSRLLLPRLATRSFTLPARVLHTVPDRHAKRSPEQLPPLQEEGGHGGGQRQLGR